ncbi:MAG: bifunctional ornithine acetyltransferase/N-acetylglutamate synthase [Candidatus Methylomirabilis sp.]|nr:bifunctional ornithine acetyltransferase/N-acetylglutamate synthase [Deltaproteobacteria bacterium]
MGEEADRALLEYMKRPELDILLDLRQGAGYAVYYTTDLSHEYVTINADYQT